MTVSTDKPMSTPITINMPKTINTPTKITNNIVIITEPSQAIINSRVHRCLITSTEIICCDCYNKSSIDARCCGACYCCCPEKTKEYQCNVCPNTFCIYWNSGYVQTEAINGSPDTNGCCCMLCFPVKFTLFFPCFLGSVFNNCINYMRDTDLNYLC